MNLSVNAYKSMKDMIGKFIKLNHTIRYGLINHHLHVNFSKKYRLQENKSTSLKVIIMIFKNKERD